MKKKEMPVFNKTLFRAHHRAYVCSCPAGRVTTAGYPVRGYLNGSATPSSARGTTVGQAPVALVGPRVHLTRIRGPTFRARQKIAPAHAQQPRELSRDMNTIL